MKSIGLAAAMKPTYSLESKYRGLPSSWKGPSTGVWWVRLSDAFVCRMIPVISRLMKMVKRKKQGGFRKKYGYQLKMVRKWLSWTMAVALEIPGLTQWTYTHFSSAVRLTAQQRVHKRPKVAYFGSVSVPRRKLWWKLTNSALVIPECACWCTPHNRDTSPPIVLCTSRMGQ